MARAMRIEVANAVTTPATTSRPYQAVLRAMVSVLPVAPGARAGRATVDLRSGIGRPRQAGRPAPRRSRWPDASPRLRHNGTRSRSVEKGARVPAERMADRGPVMLRIGR